MLPFTLSYTLSLPLSTLADLFFLVCRGPKRYDYDSKHKVWFYHRDNSLMRDLLNQELKVLMNNESVDVDLGEEDTD